MLEAGNLEPLLDFLGGLGFPILREGPIDGLARVPRLVSLLTLGPPHVSIPPGVAVGKRVELIAVGCLFLEGLA